MLNLCTFTHVSTGRPTAPLLAVSTSFVFVFTVYLCHSLFAIYTHRLVIYRTFSFLSFPFYSECPIAIFRAADGLGDLMDRYKFAGLPGVIPFYATGK